MNIGDKIKTLRKTKKLTQEQLAEYLGVSSQAVSKWETGLSCPDIEMLPKIAIFFETTVDDLLDYDKTRIANEVDDLITESIPLRKEPEKAEAFYREALKKYPNNEILLNCLMMTIGNDRSDEKIEIGEKILEQTRNDETKYDVIRLLAQTYHAIGQDAMASYYVDQMPEIYFSKTEIEAAVTSGDVQERAIERTEEVCMMTLLAMTALRIERSKDKTEQKHLEEMALNTYRAYEFLSQNEGKKVDMQKGFCNEELLKFYR